MTKYTNLKRAEAIKKIHEAIVFAIQSGFKVAVASDDEGNDYNNLNPIAYPMFYSDTECMPNAIVLGVYGRANEEDLFKPIDEDEIKKWSEANKVGKICKNCGEVLLDNQSVVEGRHSTCI